MNINTKVISNSLVILIFFFTLSLLPTFKVLADSFYPGDIYKCEFGFATGIQYKNLDPNIEYDLSMLSGQKDNWIQNTPIKNITNINDLYGGRYNIANNIAVPPNTNVEIGYWAYNNTGHWVDVKGIDFFTSRSNVNDGDTTNLGTSGIYGSTCDKKNNSYCRSGKKLYFQREDGYPYDTNGNNLAKVFYSFKTIQPIQQMNFVATPIWNSSNLTVKYSITLKNISKYNLCNINLDEKLPSGNQYSNTICINGGEIKTIDFIDSMYTNYPSKLLNTITINDTNSHYESFAKGKINEYDINPETRNSFVWRNDLDHNANPNWTGSQPGWAGSGFDNLSIKLIPYSFKATTTLDLLPNINLSKTVSDTDENNVSSSHSHNNEQLTYKVSASNTGGKTSNMQIVDTFDNSLIDILDADGGVINDKTITWNKNLQHDEVVNFTLKAKIKNLFQGDYNIINKVITTNPNTQEVKVVTNLSPHVSLVINKTLSDQYITNAKEDSVQLDDPINVNRKVHFDISYTNNGDADAHNVELTDDLSEFINTPIFEKVDNISSNGDFNPDLKLIKWKLSTLSPNLKNNVSFDLYLKRSTQYNLDLHNKVQILSDEIKPIHDHTITHLISPIIQLTKTVDKNIAKVGDDLNYVVTVNNVGIGNAYNLDITDKLPDGVQLNLSELKDATYNSDSNTINLKIKELLGNSLVKLNFQVRANILNSQVVWDINNSAILSSESLTPIISTVSTRITCELECQHLSKAGDDLTKVLLSFILISTGLISFKNKLFYKNFKV